MNTFNWSKAIGYGIALWVIMFIVATILVLVGVTLSTGWVFALGILAAILSYSFAAVVDPHSTGSALGYGLTWAIVGLLLDAIISRQFAAGAGLTGMWSYWVGYALVLLAPWAEMAVRQTPRAAPR